MGTSRFTYRRVAAAHFEVARRSDGVVIGEAWRTRDGYRVRYLDGSTETTFGLSRDTAVGATIAQFASRRAADAAL